ncbi:hypothetical protein DEF24_03330 [Marinitenerispora sediminis]|uniref:Uncharacterized protein n=1 Tax=Marinitenerispora sediminis TaxID=1931232 RepID=A0A368TA45_9ACTN|nr:hypothetical protein DEF24_03330 [Marinitenerispora sediminis]
MGEAPFTRADEPCFLAVPARRNRAELIRGSSAVVREAGGRRGRGNRLPLPSARGRRPFAASAPRASRAVPGGIAG